MVLILMQDGQSQADRVRAAMAKSLEQQRASIRRQAEAAGAVIFRTTSPPVVTGVPYCDPIPEPQLARMIDDAANKHGVDSVVVREVARQESAFRPCVVSPKGAEGLMQLMPATQFQFGVSDAFNPEQSLEAGSKLLKLLLDRYHGDLPMALSAYNAGAGRVDKAGGIPNIPETKNYVANILGRLLP